MYIIDSYIYIKENGNNNFKCPMCYVLNTPIKRYQIIQILILIRNPEIGLI